MVSPPLFLKECPGFGNFFAYLMAMHITLKLHKVRPYFGGLALILCLLITGSCGTNTPLQNEDPSESIAFGRDDTFEVVTWNLRDFPQKGNETVDDLSRLIPEMKVDLIAFQEIQNSSSLLELARRIPHYNALIADATSSYRLAYLYDERKITINNHYSILIGESNPFPRPPYVLDLTWEGQNYIVVNNHLKAFGNNHIDESDPWDEEMRRRLACQKLDHYIKTNWNDKRVIVVGDMNDQIAEPEEYNVFMPFLSYPDEYLFADMAIAQNPQPATVSYPPSFSHIDHILITNELFGSFSQPQSSCQTIQIEKAMGTWQNYYSRVSDHRPVAIRLGTGM